MLEPRFKYTSASSYKAKLLPTISSLLYCYYDNFSAGVTPTLNVSVNVGKLKKLGW